MRRSAARSLFNRNNLASVKSVFEGPGWINRICIWETPPLHFRSKLLPHASPFAMLDALIRPLLLIALVTAAAAPWGCTWRSGAG